MTVLRQATWLPHTPATCPSLEKTPAIWVRGGLCSRRKALLPTVQSDLGERHLGRHEVSDGNPGLWPPHTLHSQLQQQELPSHSALSRSHWPGY